MRLLNFIKSYTKKTRERKNNMSFSKEELQKFSEDYKPDEADADPAIIYDPKAIEASRRLSQDGFTDVEAIIPQIKPKTTDQPRTGGKFVSRNTKPVSVTQVPRGVVENRENRLAVDTRPHPIKLFLVEGRVRMEPKSAERSSVQTEQKRIVWADNVDEAIAKFGNYFVSLNTNAETYIVIGTMASEAID